MVGVCGLALLSFLTDAPLSLTPLRAARSAAVQLHTCHCHHFPPWHSAFCCKHPQDAIAVLFLLAPLLLVPVVHTNETMHWDSHRFCLQSLVLYSCPAVLRMPSPWVRYVVGPCGWADGTLQCHQQPKCIYFLSIDIFWRMLEIKDTVWPHYRWRHIEEERLFLGISGQPLPSAKMWPSHTVVAFWIFTHGQCKGLIREPHLHVKHIPYLYTVWTRTHSLDMKTKLRLA